MKSFFNSIKYLLISLLSISAIAFTSCESNNDYYQVLNAYNIRLNGNADSAKVLLDKILEKDSTNAIAWYELARTKHHIGLGNPRELINKLEEIQFTINKAVEYDASNVIYAFYKGIMSYTRAYLSLMRGEPGQKIK